MLIYSLYYFRHTRYCGIILFHKIYIMNVSFSDFLICIFVRQCKEHTRYIEMHLSALVFLIITCALAHSAVGITEIVDSDSVYFPDQTDYIKLAIKCKDNMILWPGNHQCYVEGEQGPCNIGRILIFNRRLLKPYCKDFIF